MKEEQLNKLSGIAAAPGLSVANAYLYFKEKLIVNEESIEDVDTAIANLREALEKSRKELNKIFAIAIDKMGEKRAGIFEAQMMILDDPILLDNIFNRIINEKKTPEFIVYDEISKYQNMMNESTHNYLKERSQDIEDIKNRIIRNLKKQKWKSRITEDVIVVTNLLTPADTVLFSRINVKGYVTDFGGLTSHAAIVARSLKIPAVVGIHDATSRIKHGDQIIVDGFNGEVIINPNADQLKHYHDKLEHLQQLDEELTEIIHLPAMTADGRRINVQANLDLSDEIEMIVNNGAEGIGLLRTEQIFEEYEDFPDEDEQFKVYKHIAEKIYPGIVTIRVLDIGGDKVLPIDIKEPNPFLGWRGVRLLLDNKTIYKNQIRAILRAGIHKNVKIMIPMITSIDEIHQSIDIIQECKVELKVEGKTFEDNISVGIMMEVPAAAIMAKEFADEVDFMSIGTNDLIQYLLAVDRGNELVAKAYQFYHPSVIRTLKYIIDKSNEASKDLSICGEMAADAFAVPLLIGLGLETLSVSASAIPSVKQVIRRSNYSECKKLADDCLNFLTEREIFNRVEKYFSTSHIDITKTLMKEDNENN